MVETMRVKITDEELESWYRGRIGDIFIVEKEPEHNYKGDAIHRIYPDNGKLILAKNCVPITLIEEYPTLRIQNE